MKIRIRQTWRTQGKLRIIRPSIALALVCVALLGGTFLLPSFHWRAANNKALQDSHLISTLASYPDRISMILAKDPALLHVALFGADGRSIYPEQSGHVPFQFQLSERRLIEIARIQKQASASDWLKFDSEGLRLLNCRSKKTICLIYDRTELEDLLGVSRGTLMANQAHHTWRVVLVSTAFVGTLLLLLHFKRLPGTAGVKLVPERHSALRGKLEIILTPREMKLLVILIERDGSVVTKDELYDAGWGRKFMPNSRALDQQIINLRKKLNPDQNLPKLIETVRGVGYRLCV